MKYLCTINAVEYSIEILDGQHVTVNGREMTVDFKRVGDQPVFSLLLDGQSHDALVYSGDDGWVVQIKSRLYAVTVEDERSKKMKPAAGAGLNETGEILLKAPMPGLVVAVSVEEGQEIQKGQVVMILESMKMQNELKASRGGKVGRIHVKPGETVEQRQVLLTIS